MIIIMISANAVRSQLLGVMNNDYVCLLDARGKNYYCCNSIINLNWNSVPIIARIMIMYNDNV